MDLSKTRNGINTSKLAQTPPGNKNEEIKKIVFSWHVNAIYVLLVIANFFFYVFLSPVIPVNFKKCVFLAKNVTKIPE